MIDQVHFAEETFDQHVMTSSLMPFPAALIC
jgi:hypothetical protein